jgi:hypothetical protein
VSTRALYAVCTVRNTMLPSFNRCSRSLFSTGVLVLLVCSCVTCGFASQVQTILLVEALTNNGATPAGYRIAGLSEHVGEVESLLRLKKTAYLLQCSRGSIYYLDDGGGLWRLPLSTQKPIQIATTGFIPREGVATNVVLDTQKELMYTVSNTRPGDMRAADNSFVVTKYSYKGPPEILTSKMGRAFAIRSLSSDILEVFTNNGLLQIDISTGDVKHIRLLEKINASDIQRIEGGLIFFGHDGGADVDVRNGTPGRSIFRMRINDGFALVVDYNSRKRELLMVVVDPNFGPDRLVRVDLKTGEQTDVYKAASIGSACFAGDEDE